MWFSIGVRWGLGLSSIFANLDPLYICHLLKNRGRIALSSVRLLLRQMNSLLVSDHVWPKLELAWHYVRSALNIIMHTGQAHCVDTQSTSICMHISYLPHNVWGTRLTPSATSNTSQQFATLAQDSYTIQRPSSNASSLEELQLQHHQHLKLEKGN